MVRLAIAGNPLFDLDLREMQRETPSYTIDTLAAVRAERGEHQPLAFIIGQDSLLTLDQWHRWQDILSLCHLLVCQRPGYCSAMETKKLQRWLDSHQTHSPGICNAIRRAKCSWRTPRWWRFPPQRSVRGIIGGIRCRPAAPGGQRIYRSRAFISQPTAA